MLELTALHLALPRPPQMATPIFVPQPGKKGQYRAGLGQKGEACWRRRAAPPWGRGWWRNLVHVLLSVLPAVAAAAALAAAALRQKGERCCRRLHALLPVPLPLSPPRPSTAVRPTVSVLFLYPQSWRSSSTVCAHPQFLNRCIHPPAGLVVFLNSMGELTAYDSTGDMLWQVGLSSVHCGQCSVAHTSCLPPCWACCCCCKGLCGVNPSNRLASARPVAVLRSKQPACPPPSPPSNPPHAAAPLPSTPPPQHNAGTTWRSSEDEDAPDVVPTLRAMPLRPHAVPSVILAGRSAGLDGRLHLDPACLLATVAHLLEAAACLKQLDNPSSSLIAGGWHASRCSPSGCCSCHTRGTARNRPAGSDTPPAPLLPPRLPAAGASEAVVMSQSGEEVDAWDLPDEPAMPLQVGWGGAQRSAVHPSAAHCILAGSLACVRQRRPLLPPCGHRLHRLHQPAAGLTVPTDHICLLLRNQTLPLQLADFNFDGYTDVLLVSTDGIWAWAQVLCCAVLCCLSPCA